MPRSTKYQVGDAVEVMSQGVYYKGWVSNVWPRRGAPDAFYDITLLQDKSVKLNRVATELRSRSVEGADDVLRIDTEDGEEEEEELDERGSVSPQSSQPRHPHHHNHYVPLSPRRVHPSTTTSLSPQALRSPSPPQYHPTNANEPSASQDSQSHKNNHVPPQSSRRPSFQSTPAILRDPSRVLALLQNSQTLGSTLTPSVGNSVAPSIRNSSPPPSVHNMKTLQESESSVFKPVSSERSSSPMMMERPPLSPKVVVTAQPLSPTNPNPRRHPPTPTQSTSQQQHPTHNDYDYDNDDRQRTTTTPSPPGGRQAFSSTTQHTIRKLKQEVEDLKHERDSALLQMHKALMTCGLLGREISALKRTNETLRARKQVGTTFTPRNSGGGRMRHETEDEALLRHNDGVLSDLGIPAPRYMSMPPSTPPDDVIAKDNYNHNKVNRNNTIHHESAYDRMEEQRRARQVKTARSTLAPKMKKMQEERDQALRMVEILQKELAHNVATTTRSSVVQAVPVRLSAESSHKPIHMESPLRHRTSY